jgi:hypothetical protein
MSVIDIAVGMAHLLAEPEDQGMVQIKLNAAEDSAVGYLQRRFFVDQLALNAARATVPAAITQTRSDFDAAVAAAEIIDNACDRSAALDVAARTFKEARTELSRISRGMVINDAIVAACLLILGNLYANREDVVIGTISSVLPKGSSSLLTPYRIEMGV